MDYEALRCVGVGWIYRLSPVLTVRTASLTCSNSTFCPYSVFMCFVWISEQTAIISLYSINWLVFVTETECVYCAVRTGSLNIIQVNLRSRSRVNDSQNGTSLTSFEQFLFVEAKISNSESVTIFLFYRNSRTGGWSFEVCGRRPTQVRAAGCRTIRW
jgi:hypothetical protein